MKKEKKKIKVKYTYEKNQIPLEEAFKFLSENMRQNFKQIQEKMEGRVTRDT